MKKKRNGGGVFCQLNLIGKIGPNAKIGKKLPNIEKIFFARFAHSAFYKIHISEQLTAIPQFNMQNMFFFFFCFFFSKQSS